jgi:hypothetical protein
MTEALVKLVPVAVTVKAGPPATIDAGDTDVSTGLAGVPL